MFSPAVTDDSETIYLLKRENLELRRAVAPLVAHAQRLVEGRMPNIPDGMRTHFHDLGDHLLRVNDYVESYESLLMTMLQASQRPPGPAAEHRHAQDGRLRRPPGRPHGDRRASTG